MQMVTGIRGGGALGLIFRGCLWRDLEETCTIVVETLHRRLLRNRRVSRRAKADFFSSGTIEHLRKVGSFFMTAQKQVLRLSEFDVCHSVGLALDSQVVDALQAFFLFFFVCSCHVF